MARKRLGDFLRQEGQQSLEPEVEIVQNQQQESMPESSDSEVEPIDEPTSEELLEPDETLSMTNTLDENSVPLSLTMPTTQSKQRINPTKAQLEETVTELKEIVQEAQLKEGSLQQQIADLQSELQKQKTLAKKFQAELDEAKKVILQLSEVNSQLIEEVNSYKKETKSFRSQKLDKLPHHSIQSSSPSTKITNADIGWVD